MPFLIIPLISAASESWRHRGGPSVSRGESGAPPALPLLSPARTPRSPRAGGSACRSG